MPEMLLGHFQHDILYSRRGFAARPAGPRGFRERFDLAIEPLRRVLGEEQFLYLLCPVDTLLGWHSKSTVEGIGRGLDVQRGDAEDVITKRIVNANRARKDNHAGTLIKQSALLDNQVHSIDDRVDE